MVVYCIKVRQRRLKDFGKHSFHYFPYDRIYLIPKRKKAVVKRLFRYSFVLEVTPVLRDALNALEVSHERTIGIDRNDQELEWKESKKPLDFLNKGSWVMAVPTYAINVPVTPDKLTKKAKLAYVLSFAVKTMHNTKIHLPRVMLHTPKKTVPLMCSVCAKIPDYYANQCSPGRATCRRNIDMHQLGDDTSFKDGVKNSVKNAGEIK